MTKSAILWLLEIAVSGDHAWIDSERFNCSEVRLEWLCLRFARKANRSAEALQIEQNCEIFAIRND